MPRHRSHSIDFKRQVVAEYHAGETLHALGRRHDLSRNLIRIWFEKAEAGSLDQDMASAELLSEYETRIVALEPVRQGVTEHFGGVEKDAAQGLAIRHDHGSPYMSRDFQKEIAWLGATSSPAFVRAPEGNGCAERFIRTLKENLLWVRTFRTVEELRLALIDFRRTYNETWLIEWHGHRSPAEFRRDRMDTMPLAA